MNKINNYDCIDESPLNSISALTLSSTFVYIYCALVANEIEWLNGEFKRIKHIIE